MKNKLKKRRIEKEELLNVLSALRPGTAKDDIIEQSSNFFFLNKRAIAYNEYVCISYPFDTELNCCVNADKFYKLVQGLPNERINMSLQDTGLSLTSKSVRIMMNAVVNDKMSVYIDGILKDMSGHTWEKLPSNFCEAISQCLFSTAKFISYEALMSIFVDKTYAYSSDNLRISRVRLKKDMKSSFLITRYAATDLIKFPLTSYCQSKTWIHFKTDDDIYFSCRKMVGDFPDCSMHFAVKGTKVILPENMLAVVDNVSILTSELTDLDKTILLRLENGRLTCRADDSIGWIERDVTIDYDGKPLLVHVHPTFFQQAVGKAVELIIGKTSVLFTAGGFEHVMSLSAKE